LTGFVLPPATPRRWRISSGCPTKSDRRSSWLLGTGRAAAALRKYFRQKHVAEVQTAEKLVATKRKERDDFRNSWPSAMVMRDAEKERDTFLLIRQYNRGANEGRPVSDLLLAPGCRSTASAWPNGCSIPNTRRRPEWR
jgi:hypothetical protein